MKCLIVLFAVIAISVAMTPEEKNEIRTLAKECRTESGVEKEVLAKLKDGDVVDDPKLKSFLYCLYKKTKFYRADGTVDTDRVRSKLPQDLTDAQKDAIINECLSIKGTDAKDTAYLHYKCYRNKSSKNNVDLLTP